MGTNEAHFVLAWSVPRFTGNYNDVFRVNIYLYRNSILWQEIKVLPELLMHDSKAYLLYTETEPETAQHFVFYDLWSVVNLNESKQISFGFIQLRWWRLNLAYFFSKAIKTQFKLQLYLFEQLINR